MTTTMDTSMAPHDDLNLMGMQELDSTLSIFESSRHRDSSAAGSSNFHFENTIDFPESLSNTIIVQSPGDQYSKMDSLGGANHEVGYHEPRREQPHKFAPHGNPHLRPESARASMASSMTTDLDDVSSALSSLSSKGTSPTGFDQTSTDNTKGGLHTPRREKYEVRAKVSIPTDIPHSEYARQCIAAAESSRLNPYSLHPEEYVMLREHISHPQATTYLNIRNGILRLWTRNPQIGVMRDEAIGCAKDARWFDVARVCHEWLVRRGYINYGCLEHQEPRKTKKPKSLKRKRKTVAVIGAGMSGLGCARQLEGLFAQFSDRFQEMGEDPPQVVVLEARDRIGGRVFSRAFNSKPDYPTLSYGSRHTAEMGGMIITGFDRGNPLNVIVRAQLALPYHALRAETTIYDSTGKPVDNNRDQYAEQLFNYILDRVSEYKFKIPLPRTIDGDKDLLDSGRDISGDGHKSVLEVEDLQSQAPSSEPVQRKSPSTELQLVPVSLDRLTGRAHLEPGIPAVHTAAFKAKEIGWLLRPGVGIESDLDLETAVRSKYATLGSVFDEAIRQYTRIVDFTPLDLRLINWHVANLEYSNAITCNRLSLGGWDLDAGNEWEGKHTMVTGGYQQVPRGLLNCPRPLDVRRKSNVKKISYSPDNSGPSIIECEDGETVQADYVISTIPLGVLKQPESKKNLFHPPLPDWKAGAISRIGFGVLNKVVLVYKEAFWDESRDIFGTLRTPNNRFSLEQSEYFSQRGRFFQWFNCSNTTGLPTLLALMAGAAAFQTENTPDGELIAEATSVLKSVFGDKVPQPVEAVVTRWGSDKFARGSYSYTGPEFQPNDYEDMARPIGNLFFAGEHTCGTHPATVHGAYISGLRVASEVLETMIGPIDFPVPLIPPKDLGAKRKADSAQILTDPKQARLDAYDWEIYSFIVSKIGERPMRPGKNHANPYRMYSKDMWDKAKGRCEEGRRPGKGKPISNEVKKMVTKMWNDASEEEKRPYIERADAEKIEYASAISTFAVRIREWEEEAVALRTDYVKEHPSVPGPEEVDSSSRRDRRAKRIGGYAEDSASDREL